MGYMPDMSRIMPDMVPKRLDGIAKSETVDILIKEGCVAELVHQALITLGFVCVWIWKGMGGWIVSLLFAIGNVPYIIIQRYNRPRLMRLYKWLLAREQKERSRGGQAEQLGEVTDG